MNILSTNVTYSTVEVATSGNTAVCYVGIPEATECENRNGKAILKHRGMEQNRLTATNRRRFTQIYESA